MRCAITPLFELPYQVGICQKQADVQTDLMSYETTALQKQHQVHDIAHDVISTSSAHRCDFFSGSLLYFVASNICPLHIYSVYIGRHSLIGLISVRMDNVYIILKLHSGNSHHIRVLFLERVTLQMLSVPSRQTLIRR